MVAATALRHQGPRLHQKPADQASYLMLKDDNSRLICTLNSREQAVIRMRFGLDDGNPKTLEDIGRKFSITCTSSVNHTAITPSSVMSMITKVIECLK